MTAPQPETTDILGYFNRNPFPVVISINALNVNVTVGSKKYLLNTNGDRINDPILRRSAKQLYGLTIELSPTPLPVVMLPRPNLVVQSTGFGGVHNTKPEKSVEAAAAPKRVITTSKEAAVAPAKSAVAGSTKASVVPAAISREHTKSGNPVRGMTAEAARAAGLILPTTASNDGVQDDSLELTGDKIPEIQFAHDIRGKRRPKPAAAAAPVAAPAEVDEATAAMADVETVDVGKLTAELKAKTEAEAAPAPAPTPAPEPVEEAQSTAIEDDPAVDELERQIAAASEAVQVHVPESEPEVTTEPAPTPAPQTDNPFSIDGKTFPSRSYLERYVKRHYKPEEVDGIMAKYPANKRAAKAAAATA